MNSKKYILFIVILICSSSLQAQLSDSLRWHMTTYFWTGYTGSLSYQTVGDTTINNQSYYKIYETNDSIFDINFAIYRGAIRENGLEWRAIEANDSIEYTLYDFGLQEGDTIVSQNPWAATSLEMVVDTIFFVQNSGHTYKYFQMKTIEPFYEWYTESWIEGIGSMNGLINTAFPIIDAGFELSCFKRQDNLAYKTGTLDCWYDEILSNKAIKQEIGVNIFPNPASDLINIELEKPHLFLHIETYDLNGRLIEKTNDFRINVANYPHLFLVKILTSEGVVVKKVLKE